MCGLWENSASGLNFCGVIWCLYFNNFLKPLQKNYDTNYVMGAKLLGEVTSWKNIHTIPSLSFPQHTFVFGVALTDFLRHFLLIFMRVCRLVFRPVIRQRILALSWRSAGGKTQPGEMLYRCHNTAHGICLLPEQAAIVRCRGGYRIFI